MNDQPSANQKLSGREVAEQFRRAIRGEVEVELADPEYSWDDAYAGNVEFLIGDWRVWFFNDCDELDYCDNATAPDGRAGEFDEWYDAKEEPTDLLESSEHAALERLLEQAR